MSKAREELPLDPAFSFLQRLWEVNHALERVSSRMEKAVGVTAPQRFIVRCVGKYPGVTAGQLARTLHLDPGTISATLRRLERQGLIERRQDPRDRRRLSLVLTPRGRKIHELRKATVEAAVVEALGTASSAEIRATRTMLRRLVDALARQVDEK